MVCRRSRACGRRSARRETASRTAMPTKKATTVAPSAAATPQPAAATTTGSAYRPSRCSRRGSRSRIAAVYWPCGLPATRQFAATCSRRISTSRSVPGPGCDAIRMHEVQRGEALCARGQRQLPERAAVEFLADVFLGEPGVAEAHAGSADRRRLVRDRPAAFVEPAARAGAPRARVAHDEVAMRAQVVECRRHARVAAAGWAGAAAQTKRTCISASPMKPPGTRVPTMKSTRPSVSASSTPPSTASISSMRMSGCSLPN